MNFYKNNESDKIWIVDNLYTKGEFLFSFDKKTVFNFFSDYPAKLSKEQIKIFKKEQPILAELK